LAEERDIDILQTRNIDYGYETVQVLANSSIFEVGESWENNAVPWRWRQAEVVSAGGERKEMERKCFELGHPAQGTCERFWGKISNAGNFVELKVYEVLGG